MLKKPKFNKIDCGIDLSKAIKYDTEPHTTILLDEEEKEAETVFEISEDSSGWLGGLSIMKDCAICREPKIDAEDKDSIGICADCLAKLRKLIL